MIGAAIAVLLAAASPALASDRPATVLAADGARLAATLTVPSGGGTHAAAVIVGGLGPHGRNGDGQYREMARELAERGVVVLRYDKRGLGSSEGDALAWLDADRLAEDAAAAVRAVRAVPEVDAARVSLVGHSQGGMLALRAAVTAPVARVVTLASPGQPLGLFPRAAGPVQSMLERVVGLAATRATLHRDPRRDAVRVDRPLLAVHGARDGVVPPANLTRLARARQERGLPTRTMLVPGVGHTLRTRDGRGNVPDQVLDRVATFVDAA